MGKRHTFIEEFPKIDNLALNSLAYTLQLIEDKANARFGYRSWQLIGVAITSFTVKAGGMYFRVTAEIEEANAE